MKHFSPQAAPRSIFAQPPSAPTTRQQVAVGPVAVGQVAVAPVAVAPVVTAAPPTQAEISARAYAIFEKSGGKHGHCTSNWHQAELDLTKATETEVAKQVMQNEGGPVVSGNVPNAPSST